MGKFKMWAKKIKKKIFILYLSCKDKRVPWYAKLFAACIVAYAFSPIDLIPDFIPILGYLDDLVIVPIGIIIALKMIPKNVISDCEAEAEKMMKQGRPKNWIAGSLIILIWTTFILWLFLRLFQIIK